MLSHQLKITKQTKNPAEDPTLKCNSSVCAHTVVSQAKIWFCLSLLVSSPLIHHWTVETNPSAETAAAASPPEAVTSPTDEDKTDPTDWLHSMHWGRFPGHSTCVWLTIVSDSEGDVSQNWKRKTVFYVSKSNCEKRSLLFRLQCRFFYRKIQAA